MATHQERAASFGAVADDYHAYRPPLPLEAARSFGAADATVLLDLAAGTGLGAQVYVELGCSVIAVEPDAAMLAVLERNLPTVDARLGTAEAIPAPDHSVDMVAVCSAWHWFDHARAISEITRVLRPGGRLAICWNGLDQRTPWVAELAELRSSTSATNDLGDRFGHSPDRISTPEGLFGEPTTGLTPWTWRRSPEDLVAMLGTYSAIITGSAAAREAVIARGAALLQPQVDNDGMIEVPMAARWWSATLLS